jgi:serine protease Do
VRPAWSVCAVFGLLSGAVWAETQYFLWTDTDGSKRITVSQPDIGVSYTTVSGPDPVHWYNPPDPPAEIAQSEPVPRQSLFPAASASVYSIFGKDQSNNGKLAYGSAVAITSKLAITNCHIVMGAADNIYIGGAQNEGVEHAKLIGADFVADRCVVGVSRIDLQPVAGMRRFDSIQVGEPVYAIGNPRMLERTLSDGLLSGKRNIRGDRFLQTTAAISPGSSGGGLFDARGNLLGITSFTLRDSQNLNFAIPAEDFWK